MVDGFSLGSDLIFFFNLGKNMVKSPPPPHEVCRSGCAPSSPVRKYTTLVKAKFQKVDIILRSWRIEVEVWMVVCAGGRQRGPGGLGPWCSTAQLLAGRLQHQDSGSWGSQVGDVLPPLRLFSSSTMQNGALLSQWRFANSSHFTHTYRYRKCHCCVCYNKRA